MARPDRVVERRSRRVTARLLVGGGLLLLAVLFSGKAVRKMPDLDVYWTAAVRARSAEPLYRVEDQHYQFKYLPAFAVLAMPAGAVPLQTAKIIWYACSVALLASLVALSLPVLPERRRPGWVLVTLTVLAMAKFFAHEVVLGQVNGLFGVIAVLGILALRHGREVPAGLLFALAIVVKPYAVIFLPWLAARRRAGSIVTASASMAGVVLLPAFVYGMRGNLELHRAWWKTVTESTAPNLTNADNVSIAAMFAKWLGAGTTASVLALVTCALILGLAAFVFVRRRLVSSRSACTT
jgi:hypothetical protein